jgi:hypothetical protein
MKRNVLIQIRSTALERHEWQTHARELGFASLAEYLRTLVALDLHRLTPIRVNAPKADS